MRKINTFWNWFQDNNQTIKNLKSHAYQDKIKICNCFNKQLGYYCKELDFIIVFPKNENQKSELIITANGNPEHIETVSNLISNAPILRYWKFTAFIQTGEEINKKLNQLYCLNKYHEVVIKIPIVIYDEKQRKQDIILHLENYNVYCNNKTLEQTIYFILTDLVNPKSQYKNMNFEWSVKRQSSFDQVIELELNTDN